MASAPSKAMQPATPAWKPETLPPFPAVAVKALNLIAGRDTSLLELCNLVRSDSAFTVAILKIANSPLVAFSGNITSLVQAATLLGFRRMKSILLTVALKDYLKTPFNPLLRSCWRHSVACAIIAERAAKSSGLDNDFAYTAGILHDIGRAAMATAMPQPYLHMLEAEVDRPQDLLPRERELFGVDHCQAGASLVIAWNLPAIFIDITSAHHHPPSTAHDAASLLPPSCCMADTLGFGVAKYRAPVPYADIIAQLPEPARAHFPPDPKDFVSEMVSEIMLIESV